MCVLLIIIVNIKMKYYNFDETHISILKEFFKKKKLKNRTFSFLNMSCLLSKIILSYNIKNFPVHEYLFKIK